MNIFPFTGEPNGREIGRRVATLRQRLQSDAIRYANVVVIVGRRRWAAFFAHELFR